MYNVLFDQQCELVWCLLSVEICCIYLMHIVFFLSFFLQSYFLCWHTTSKHSSIWLPFAHVSGSFAVFVHAFSIYLSCVHTPSLMQLKSTQGLIVDQTIEKVSFCAPDRHHEKGFAYISRDGTTRRWMCHGFLALKESVRILFTNLQSLVSKLYI